MDSNEDQVARDHSVKDYLIATEAALATNDEARATFVTNFIGNAPSLNNKLGNPLEETRLLVQDLNRIAPAGHKAQLHDILSNINLGQSEEKQYELLSLAQRKSAEILGTIYQCDRCKGEIGLSTACSISAICNTVDEKTVGENPEDRYPRFASLAAKRVFSPCSKCLEETQKDYELAGSCQCLSQYATPHQGANTSYHCKNCFEDLKVEMKKQNTCESVRTDPEHGTFSLLDYQCDCGKVASPYTVRICRLCRRTCKPYTLNKDNEMIRSVFGGEVETSIELTGTGIFGDDKDYWTAVEDDWDNGFCGYFVKPEYFKREDNKASPDDTNKLVLRSGQDVDEDICRSPDGGGEGRDGEVAQDRDHE